MNFQNVYSFTYQKALLHCFSINEVKKDDIPFLLPKLKMNKYEIKRAESNKFLFVLLDESFYLKASYHVYRK